MAIRPHAIPLLILTFAATSTATAAQADELKPGPADKDADKQKFKKTKSGLKYRILRKSKGEQPTATSIVTVHYRGWLPDKSGKGGREFDSSYKRKRPTTFPLKRVIKGWTEGLQLVRKGGMIELEIPPELAYGKRGVGDVIPADATLRFIVELIEVKAGMEP